MLQIWKNHNLNTFYNDEPPQYQILYLLLHHDSFQNQTIDSWTQLIFIVPNLESKVVSS